MTHTPTSAVDCPKDWLTEHIAEDSPPVRITQPVDTGLEAPPSSPHPGSADGQIPANDHTHSITDSGAARDSDRDEPADTGGDVNSAAKRALLVFAGVVSVVAVAIVAAFALIGGGPPPATHPVHRGALQPVAPPPPSTTNQPVPNQDQAISYTASTTSCTPTAGSGQQAVARSPQALSDTASDSAWVCGRGPQESWVDGQVLHVQFNCSAASPQSACSFETNSLSVTPGSVAKTKGGKDEWAQHRIPRKLQFNFFNGNQLAGEPFFLDTHDIHGPVPANLPARILASRVDVMILYTERPPAAPPTPDTGAPGDDPGTPNGVASTVLGQPHSGTNDSDAAAEPSPDTASTAVDATFAMSQLEFFGHAPN